MEIIKTNNADIIQGFIESYWKPNHSLAKSKGLLNFQHYNDLTKEYNYYLIEDEGVIWGLLGYVPVSHYDQGITDGDVWGAIWKVRDDCPIHGVGIEMMDRLLSEHEGCFGAIGISNIAKKIYRLYGMKLGAMSQYYIGNPVIKEFCIGKNITNDLICAPSDKEWKIKVLYNLDSLGDIECSYRPQKTIEYFRNRYQNHPIYKYIYWGIYDANSIVSLWVIRRVTIGNSSVYRIVDMMGNIEGIPNIGNLIQQELIAESVEYVDCLNYGIPSSAFENLGFIVHETSSKDVIVPNYFEPFEKSNVKIELAYTVKDIADNYVVFKGDSDQDRPNLL